MTVDEPINVSIGAVSFKVATEHPHQLVQPQAIQGLWGTAHDHPPLARFLLGGVYHWRSAHDADGSFHPKRARPASGIAFGFVVFFASRLATQISGTLAGFAAGIACTTMPRLYGHALLASPEVISAATILLGLSSASWAIAQRRPVLGAMAGEIPPTTRSFRGPWIALFAAGVCFGIALLTKLTAILVPVAVVVAWILVRPRLNSGPTAGRRGTSPARPVAPSPLRLVSRTALPLSIYVFIGLSTFLLLWPWMWPVSLPGYSPGWSGTLERLKEFAATGVERATIYVYYFGQQYPTKTAGVPWHYVWVFFFATVPLATHVFAIAGLPRMIRSARGEPAASLVLIEIAIFLLFFTLPIDRYDSERLFLPVFPLWAIVAGIGVHATVDYVSSKVPSNLARWCIATACLLFAGSGVTAIVRLHPYELSYFNAAVGGLAGADRIGLEATYWGDSLSSAILDAFAAQAEEGERAVLLPTLYEGHARFLTLDSPAMIAKRLVVIAPDRIPPNTRWAILFHRDGYLLDELPQRVMTEGQATAEVSREGVWLGRLYRLPPGFSWRGDEE